MNIGEFRIALRITSAYLDMLLENKQKLQEELNFIQDKRPEDIKKWKKVWKKYSIIMDEERRVRCGTGRSLEVFKGQLPLPKGRGL